MTKVHSITDVLEHYGLGYPPGYRPLSADLFVEWQGKRIHLEIETVHGHRLCWHEEDASGGISHPGGCDAGTISRANWDWEEPEDETHDWYRVILDAEEISLKEAARGVQLFFTHIGIAIQEVDFAWRDSPYTKSDDLKSWEKDQEQSIDWLRRGAPPYTIVMAGEAVDNLIDLTGDELTDEEEMMQD